MTDSRPSSSVVVFCRAALLAVMVSVAPRVGAAPLEVRGLMDAVLADDGSDVRYLNYLRTGVSAFDPLHTRLFFEGGSERTRAFVQFVLRDTSAAPMRVYGAYFLHQPFEAREFYVQAGKMPTPEGSWGPRMYADRNPLIGAPLAYTWQTTLPSSQLPVDVADLVARKGRGAFGLSYTDGGGVRGKPGPSVLTLYDNCWNDGIALLGIQNGIEYQFAATTGSSGVPVNGVDTNDDVALHARIGWSPQPEIVLRLSWSRGAYLNRSVESYLPAGRSVNDYHQQLWMASLELSRGHVVFNGEFVTCSFDTPLLDDGLDLRSGYADLAWSFAVGWTAAARFDTIRFGEVDAGTTRTSWDQDLDRLELGLGYDITRDFLVKGVVQCNWFDEGFGEDTTLTALQTVVRF